MRSNFINWALWFCATAFNTFCLSSHRLYSFLRSIPFHTPSSVRCFIHLKYHEILQAVRIPFWGAQYSRWFKLFFFLLLLFFTLSSILCFAIYGFWQMQCHISTIAVTYRIISLFWNSLSPSLNPWQPLIYWLSLAFCLF